MQHPAEHSPLGKSSQYIAEYSPELLFPISRTTKWAELGLDGASLPYQGVDYWNCYELSWLLPSGKPVVAIGEFAIPADSPNIIESKSFKLYLNSFNQSQFADLVSVEQILTRDLSAAAQATVQVRLQALTQQPQARIAYPPGELLDDLDISCNVYAPAPELLLCSDETPREECLYSHLLKSNCLVTGQPDWAMLVIRYRGRPIERAGLLRYIVSFRNHNEFHEQCVERIYCDLMRRCTPQELLVYARYTRRGGLDINPYRSSSAAFLCIDNDREIRQ